MQDLVGRWTVAVGQNALRVNGEAHSTLLHEELCAHLRAVDTSLSTKSLGERLVAVAALAPSWGLAFYKAKPQRDGSLVIEATRPAISVMASPYFEMTSGEKAAQSAHYDRCAALDDMLGVEADKRLVSYTSEEARLAAVARGRANNE